MKNDVPQEAHEEHMDVCNRCARRRLLSERYGINFDWIDCPFDCKNDYEHWMDGAKMD